MSGGPTITHTRLKPVTSWINETKFELAHQEELDRLAKAILRLIDYMKIHNLSEADIAEIAGVNENLVHRFIHGQLSNTIVKLMNED